MAYVKVEVPDGDKCGNCMFLLRGTVLCQLFDELLEETDEYTDKLKCKACLRACKEKQNV